MLRLTKRHLAGEQVVLYPGLGDGHSQNDPRKVDELRNVIDRLKAGGEVAQTSFQGIRDSDILVVVLTPVTMQLLEASSLNFVDGV